MDDGSEFYGMGAAFHVDGWGTFLTAAHVVDEARIKRPLRQSDFQAGQLKPELFEKGFVLLLGQGLVYGRVPVALAPANNGRLILQKTDKPLCNELETLADIATVQLSPLPPAKMIATIPIRLSGRLPDPGETVLAVGFPELAC